MSSLSGIEKRKLEKFLQMEGGYVLDFSNRTFREFVRDSTGLNIDDDGVGGEGSKASRLRHFWNSQPDHVVGRLLKDLVEYTEAGRPLREQCEAVADRLLIGRRSTTATDQTRIWGDSGYRLFLSHKATVKKKAAELKESLTAFGVSAFVAHEDIEPTKEWQGEIENALASMDAFAALLTEDYHDSDWTDQEVGYALARGVPMVAVKLGKAPYGFIGKFQALSCKWVDAPWELAKLLVRHAPMLEAYIEALPSCTSFDDANARSQVLPCIRSLTESQAGKLASAFNANDQLRGSYGFGGGWESKHGPGLAHHLSRATGKEYVAVARANSLPKIYQVKQKD